MRCSQARTALSARLDGEDPGVVASALDDHLAACAGCRQWLAAAGRLDAAPLAVPAPPPDLTAAVLTRLAAERATRLAAAAHRDERLRRGLRIAVGLIAAVQLLLAMPGVLSLDGVHASHEAASVDVALAAGFLFAAYQPALARAYTPVALVLATCLAVSGGLDVLQGRAGLAHELVHLVAVGQAALLWALGRRAGPGRDTTVAAPRTGAGAGAAL
jgi:predicted anti-sigma-YlaC factor YlaD